MAAPKPLLPPRIPPNPAKQKMIPTPKVQEGTPKGVPPSPMVKSKELEDLGPSYPENNLYWQPLNSSHLPCDIETPILIRIPDAPLEYSVAKANIIRRDFLARKEGKLDKVIYKNVTHWTYFPFIDEVPF